MISADMKKIIYISALVIAFLGVGCSDWLDVLPKDRQVTADYWKSKEDVESIIASGYVYMTTIAHDLIRWGELRGGSIYSIEIEDNKMQNFQLTPGSDRCKWNRIYQVINMANSVIRYAPAVRDLDETYTEGAMRSHLTEAYFMRGLMYFYLVRNFREVPLVINPYIDDSAPYSIAKSDEAAIIDQIKADVRTALNTGAAKEAYEDNGWLGASKGRATKWALYALMADVCLWSEDYDGCVTYADSLINASATWRPVFMSIPEQWFSMFYQGNSNESVFEINWDYATYGQTNGSPSVLFKVPSDNPVYRYAPMMQDRLKAESREVVLNGHEAVRSEYGAYVAYSEDVLCVWKYSGSAEKNITAVREQQDANLIIYRMADVMLMKAEALVWKGSEYWSDAIDLVNQIRRRAYLNDLQISLAETDELALLQVILNERDMELAAEGKRWYDLVRFGKASDYKYKTQFISLIVDNNSTANDSWLRSALKNDYAWYLPIHEEEIEVNRLLIQNPYYGVTK